MIKHPLWILYFLIWLPAAFQYITIRILTQSPQRVAFSLITHPMIIAFWLSSRYSLTPGRSGQKCRYQPARGPKRNQHYKQIYNPIFFHEWSQGLSKFTIGCFNNFF